MSKNKAWSNGNLPAWIDKRYPREMVSSMKLLVERNVLEWRVSGSTHLEIRPIGGGSPCVLTTGKTADNPVYFAKYRSALRRWGLTENDQSGYPASNTRN